MTTDTVRSGVGAVNCKDTAVDEIGHLPACRNWLMTLLTIAFKARLKMVRIGRLGEIRPMTFLAFYRRTGKLVTLLIDMAGAAIGDRMFADQGKATRGVQIKNILVVLPVLRRMAILAVDSGLAAMNVGMTIGTGASDMTKLQILVTFSAICGRMTPDQWETGLFMVETDFPLFNNIP